MRCLSFFRSTLLFQSRRIFSVSHLCSHTCNASKMTLNFAANLNMLFQEIPRLTDRYKAAKENGFKYVECAFPYIEPVDEIAAARKEADVEQVLINAYPGSMDKGDFGLAAIPSRREEFFETLEMSIQYANALQCKRMHIMAGTQPVFTDLAMDEKYVENLRYAADRLQKEGILALIEPINPETVPKYYMNSLDKAIECVEKVNHPNLKLQFDFFHIQMLNGNLTKNFTKAFPYIGHIQIAQVPGRGEPDDSGEINYHYIFKLLKEMNYQGFIGVEYKPRGSTVDGLKWMKEYSDK